MSEPLTRAQVNELLACMSYPETDIKHYAKFYNELMAHDAALREQLKGVQEVRDEYYASLREAIDSEERLRQQLATTTAHLEAQRASTYQAVEREHEAKRALAVLNQRMNDLREELADSRLHEGP